MTNLWQSYTDPLYYPAGGVEKAAGKLSKYMKEKNPKVSQAGAAQEKNSNIHKIGTVASRIRTTIGISGLERTADKKRKKESEQE